MSADNEIAKLEYLTPLGPRFRVVEAQTSSLWSFPEEASTLTDQQKYTMFVTWHASEVYEDEEKAWEYVEKLYKEMEKQGRVLENGGNQYKVTVDFPSPEEAWEAAKRLGIDKQFLGGKMPKSWLTTIAKGSPCDCFCHDQLGVKHIMPCCDFTYQQRNT